MSKTKIEWTNLNWNPLTGCYQISEGCRNCYAERMAKRLLLMRNPRYTNSFKLTIHDDLIPTLKWSKKRFISAEPLLGSLKDLNLTGIHWLIAGGESGRKARPMDGEWVQELRDKCHDEKTAFFFKQWGVTNKKKAGRELDGREWMEFPQES